MQRLHGRYGRRFNDRHKRSGHVFQGRFGSKRVTDDEQMWVTARYIARNPVEARHVQKGRGTGRGAATR